MEFKGTKGEWRIDAEDFINEFGASGLSISSGNVEGLATVWGCKGKDLEQEANAHLIAAAPELLEVLQIITSMQDLILPNYETVKPEHQQECRAIANALSNAKAAINKAINK